MTQGGVMGLRTAVGRVLRWRSILARDHPMLFRARVIEVMVFAAVASVALYYWGRTIYSISLSHVPSPGELDGFFMFWYFFCGAALVWWCGDLYRYPVPNNSPSAAIAEFLLHSVCVFAIFAAPSFFAAAIAPRMIHLVNATKFDQDYAFHKSHGFWNECHATPGKWPTKDTPEGRRLAASLSRMGYKANFQEKKASYAYPGCVWELSFTTPSDESASPDELKDKFEGIVYARTIDQNWLLGWPPSLIVRAVIALAFVFVIHGWTALRGVFHRYSPRFARPSANA